MASSWRYYPRRHLSTLLSEANGLRGRSHTPGCYAQARRRTCAYGEDETYLYTLGTL